MNRNYIVYSGLAIILFMVDRITKWWAVEQLKDGSYYINQFLSFEVAFNRGISWSIFYSTNSFAFALLTFVIACIIGLLSYYMLYRLNNGYAIWGCLIAWVGGISNLFDRLYYQGVVDFIVISYRGWSWPIFNVADICIMIGVLYVAFYEL